MVEKQKAVVENGVQRSVLQQKRAIVPKNFNFKKGSLLKSPSIGSILPAVTRKFCLKIRGFQQGSLFEVEILWDYSPFLL